MRRLLAICLVWVFFLASACGDSSSSDSAANQTAAARAEKQRRAVLREAIKRIEPFFRPMGRPEPNDWLATYPETGQTFDEYLDDDPTVPTAARRMIYVQPLGSFTSEQSRVINAVSDYISAFYGLPVKALPGKRLAKPLPAGTSRMSGYPPHLQIRSGYILDDVLRPALPSDAAALIAFTADDLFPDSSMSFVFGQASFDDRVGVWSLKRLDDNATYDIFLRRTMKIAVHETGHMFSMRHCTKYECVMSGTNHLNETDSRPVDACPECMAKICWMTKTSPAERYKRLADFSVKNGLKREAAEFAAKQAAATRSE